MLPGEDPKERLPSRWTLYKRNRMLEVRLWGCRGNERTTWLPRRKKDKRHGGVMTDLRGENPLSRARGDGQPAFVL